MAFCVEVVVDVGVDRGELLKRFHPAETQHGSLSSSEWQVAILGSIVEPPSHLLALQIA